MIRLFAALPVPPDVAEGLARRQQGLPKARWRTAEQMHVTLCFFGEVRETDAAELDAVLGAVRVEPFELRLQGVGAFGEGAASRAVWAGVAPCEPLARLAAKCETAARQADLQVERRSYRPHLTLAYLRGSPADRVAAWVAGHNLLQSPPWRATAFHLYSSWSSTEGSRYDLEREYPLVGALFPSETT